jgi:uncharacterized protein YggE
MKRFLISLSLAVTASTALAQAAQPTPSFHQESITVSGNGKATVTPDRFSFTVGVQTVGPTVDQAVNQNNQRVADVLAALKKAGASAADIQTAQFNIWPQQDYREGQLPKILGYQVSNSITVRSAKITDAGRYLGVAINAGVNTSSGINFVVSNPATGRQQGLAAAMDDARAKAEILAKAAGRSLGRALVINEGVQGPAPSPYPARMAMEAKAVSDVPVEAGSQDLDFAVTVTYELR